ncbi:MAG TPA: zf-HC2 domain-containing protein [Vicinamibacterales bacterium]
MKAASCATIRRRLQAFHDDELPIADQIAVVAHVKDCASCAADLADLNDVSGALQGLVAQRLALTHEEAAVFNTTVVSRLTAENGASLMTHVRELFDDMHVVYAALGAAGAAIACVTIMLGMMRFATAERPDSLAAIVNVLATPLECESGNEAGDVSGCRARWEERWTERFQRANESAEQDAVFTLEAVVTHQGHLANLGVLKSARHRHATDQVKLIEGLLEVVARARLDYPAVSQAPATSSMLWLVERATVRASKQPAPALDAPLPAKKRAANSNGRSTISA